MKAEIIKELVLLNIEFHEKLSGALVSERSLQLRNKLLSVCVLAYAIVWGGLMPNEIPFLGLKINITNQGALYFGLSLILLYLFTQFWWRAEMEFLNNKNKRRYYRFYLEAKKKELFEKYAADEEITTLVEKFDFFKDDEYRQNSHGTSLKARMNELFLPLLITIGAAASCMYKGGYILLYAQ